MQMRTSALLGTDVMKYVCCVLSCRPTWVSTRQVGMCADLALFVLAACVLVLQERCACYRALTG